MNPDTIVTEGRDAVIVAIRQALRRRSGTAWSVTGGRGTAWGWIRITAPPARRIGSSMSDADRTALGQLLGMDGPSHHQGESIPASAAYRRLYLHRALYGTDSGHTATPYWD